MFRVSYSVKKIISENCRILHTYLISVTVTYKELSDEETKAHSCWFVQGSGKNLCMPKTKIQALIILITYWSINIGISLLVPKIALNMKEFLKMHKCAVSSFIVALYVRIVPEIFTLE